MKKYIVAGILFAATMLVSCGGLQSFTFDQLYPAEVTFPEQVRTVAVVNHTPAIPSPKKNLLTLGKLDGDGKVLSETLAGGLADSRYFQRNSSSTGSRQPGSGTWSRHDSFRRQNPIAAW